MCKWNEGRVGWMNLACSALSLGTRLVRLLDRWTVDQS